MLEPDRFEYSAIKDRMANYYGKVMASIQD